jgi:riboflavin kinase / FMN adenylyltransferase
MMGHHRLDFGQAGRPLAVAIGTFDGLHRGHQALLDKAKAAALRLGFAPAVVLFDPQPAEVLAARKGAPITPRLATTLEKIRWLRAAGIETVVVVRFNAAVASLSPTAFIEWLVGDLKAGWLTVGQDFRFGAGRAGDVNLLLNLAPKLGFTFDPLATVSDGHVRIASTAVRLALAAGDLARAEVLLGRPYTISGPVVHGAKLGRTLGFPTANVALGRARRLTPALWGVYAVKSRLYRLPQRFSDPSGLTAGQVWYGAASLGRNPAVRAAGVPSLEVHLFDFDGDLYGARLAVEFCLKLRDEAHYGSLTELTTAIASDCNRARSYFHLS